MNVYLNVFGKMQTILTCTLTAPGLGNSSSGFILERLSCIGSPVLLTADSLVGLVCGNKKNDDNFQPPVRLYG